MAGRHLLTKTLAVLLLIIAVADSIRARVIIGGLSFQQMFEKADLVVIATVRKTKDTSERKKLIDVDVDASHTLPSDHFQDEVIGVETEFAVRLTLKGSKDVGKLLLHHYRLSIEENRWGYGAPNLLEIRPQGHPTFLMFLVKEKDGRYAPGYGPVRSGCIISS